MADLTNEINQMMGQSCYAIPDDVDEEDLMHELDALEDDFAAEPAMGSGPSYLQVRVALHACTLAAWHRLRFKTGGKQVLRAATTPLEGLLAAGSLNWR